MYVPFYQDRVQYERFIELRKEEIIILQEVIKEAEKRIKNKEWYSNWILKAE